MLFELSKWQNSNFSKSYGKYLFKFTNMDLYYIYKQCNKAISRKYKKFNEKFDTLGE